MGGFRVQKWVYAGRVGIGYRGSGIGNPCGSTRAIPPPELHSPKGGGSGREQTPHPTPSPTSVRGGNTCSFWFLDRESTWVDSKFAGKYVYENLVHVLVFERSWQRIWYSREGSLEVEQICLCDQKFNRCVRLPKSDCLCQVTESGRGWKMVFCIYIVNLKLKYVAQRAFLDPSMNVK